MRRGLIRAGVLLSVAVGVVITARALADGLPGDAARRIEEFERDAEAVQKKADAKVEARRGKLLEDLRALQEGYTKAGKLDEAVAVRDRARKLKADLGEDYALEIRRLEGHTGPVHKAAFSSDGRTLASGSEDGTVRLWEWKTGKMLAVLEGHKDVVLEVNYSPDGRTLATTSRDKTVILWDPVKKEKRTTLDDYNMEAGKAVFSPDGKTLATASADGLVQVRFLGGESLRKLEGHKKMAIAVAYSPDGNTLVSSGGDWNDPTKGGEVKAWDLGSGKELWSAPGQFGGVWGIAFSPDGRGVAGASLDGTVRVWDAATGEERWVLKGHTDRVIGVAYSPSGKTLASSGFDGTVRLWDPVAGKQKAVLRGHTDKVARLSFSPDGRVLASTSYDGTIRIWQLGRMDKRTGTFVR